MHPGQRISLAALTGETIDGVYVRPLGRDERARLFVEERRNNAFAWVETKRGKSWFDARRLVALS